MTVAIVSDLHLGAASGRDLLRHPSVLEALLAGLDGVDELVLLGDVVELREGPLADALAAAGPVLRELGRAMDGRRITLLAGNHDHQLAQPLIEEARSAPRGLETETIAAPPAHGPLARVTQALGPAEVRVAYPGLWVRDDVYATHGHYLDVHNTTPSFERIAIGAVQRFAGRVPKRRLLPDDYEAALAPVYALAHALAQNPVAGRGTRHSDRSVRLWQALASDSRPSLGLRLVAGVGLPAAVGALNAAGLGPLDPDLSGQALRRSALLGMRTAVERLGIDARYVVFGHTHRSGPHPRDAGWDGLVNTGSWILEPFFLGADPYASPYFPGHVAYVRDTGPPELRRLLDALPT